MEKISPAASFMFHKIYVSQNLHPTGTRFGRVFTMGKPMSDKWANDHTIAQLNVEQIFETLNGGNLSNGFRYMLI